jgi:hypothetical protein
LKVQRAQYKLTDIKDFIIQGKYIITKKAKETSENDFEFSEEDVLDAILNLTMANFDHSMTTRHNHKLWQDVYKTKVGNK